LQKSIAVFMRGLAALLIKPFLQNAAMASACLAAISFPFSVAVSNAALAATLVFALVSGLLWQGIQLLRQHHAILLLAWAIMLGLMLLSLAWSPDIKAGIGKIGHLWFVLLLPALTSLLQDEKRRQAFFLSLSIGLTAHLIYCIVQAIDLFGIALPAAGATGPNDPAGLIGHIGFGFVYGLWAGWLIMHALHQHGWQRWLPLLLALWAIGMVFIVQGRGGYLTTLVLLFVIFWKEFVHGRLGRRTPWFIAGTMLLLTAFALGPGQERIQLTWQQLQQIASGDIKDSDPRVPMWIAALKAWQLKPLIGHGVGGYMEANQSVIEAHPNLSTPFLGHPHNIYLLAMVREGIVGLASLVFLLSIWIYSGWRRDWSIDASGYLIAASGLAILVNGLTSSSFEEHYSGIMAIWILSSGLAMAYERKDRV